MRHFLGYRADGTLASLETFSGGWPTQCEFCDGGCPALSDPACKLPAAVSLRTTRANRNPDVVGYICYDCPCPPSAGICEPGCYNDYFASHYVDTQSKVCIPKPVSVMQVDGEDVANESTVSRAPGDTAKFKIVGPDVPDGATVNVTTVGPVDIVEGPDTFLLTFNGGETPEITLVAPGQGSKGTIAMSGKYIRPQRMLFRGFTA